MWALWKFSVFTDFLDCVRFASQSCISSYASENQNIKNETNGKTMDCLKIIYEEKFFYFYISLKKIAIRQKNESQIARRFFRFYFSVVYEWMISKCEIVITNNNIAQIVQGHPWLINVSRSKRSRIVTI